MLKKLPAVIMLMSVLPYATAGTASIGTANARGDMRVDNYLVKGNSTLFDGSVVETGDASADLRLNKGVEITMAADSRGKLYGDHLVLEQGASEVAGDDKFQLEANGLHVTPNKPNSRGTVSLGEGNSVQVATQTGGFGVANEQGVLLAIVHPGQSFSFAMQAGVSQSTAYSGLGLVTYENGHYYMTSMEDVKYEMSCKDFKKFNGDKVDVTGDIRPGGGAGAAGQICVKSININGEEGPSAAKIALIAGEIIGGGVALGYVIHDVNKPAATASR